MGWSLGKPRVFMFVHSVNIGRTGYGSPTSDGSVLQPRGIANRAIQVPPTGITGSATVLKNA